MSQFDAEAEEALDIVDKKTTVSDAVLAQAKLVEQAQEKSIYDADQLLPQLCLQTLQEAVKLVDAIPEPGQCPVYHGD